MFEQYKSVVTVPVTLNSTLSDRVSSRKPAGESDHMGHMQAISKIDGSHIQTMPGQACYLLRAIFCTALCLHSW